MAFSHFIEAQAPVWDAVVAELEAGRKRSHWMWFVFPQLAGLGPSPMAQRFALGSLDEARDYLAHPLLGPRLLQASALAEAAPAASAEALMGPVDALKLRSSMTLFARAAPAEPVFRAVLVRWYDGSEDPRTLALLV